MAEVWLWRDGEEPTTGGPLAKLPLADCLARLGVSPADFCSGLSTPPRFETSKYPLSKGVRIVMGSPNLRGYQHVVLRLDEVESQANSWVPGFYRCPGAPAEAWQLLSAADGHDDEEKKDF